MRHAHENLTEHAYLSAIESSFAQDLGILRSNQGILLLPETHFSKDPKTLNRNELRSHMFLLSRMYVGQYDSFVSNRSIRISNGRIYGVHGYPSPEEGVPILGEQTVYLNATRRRISSLSETSGKSSKSRDSNSSLNISSAPAEDGMSSSQREKTMTLISIPCPLTDDPESQRLSAARLAPSGSSSVSGTSSPMSSSPTLALMSGLSATDSFQSISHVSPLASPSNSPRSSPSLFSWSDTGSLTDMSFASDISAASNVSDLSLSNRSSHSHRSLLDADVVLMERFLLESTGNVGRKYVNLLRQKADEFNRAVILSAGHERDLYSRTHRLLSQLSQAIISKDPDFSIRCQKDSSLRRMVEHAVESVYHHYIYEKLFGHIRGVLSDEDRKLTQAIELLQGRRPSQFGLPPHFDVLLSLCDESGHFSIDAPPSFSNPGVVSPVSGEKAGSSDLPILSEHARQELSSVASRLLVIHMLNQFTCPLEKLHLISLFIQCVMHVAEVAVSVVRSSSPSSEPLILTTDELLPLVAWCLVVLDPPSLKANCEYMRECLPKGVGPTELGFHLVTMEAALHLLSYEAFGDDSLENESNGSFEPEVDASITRLNAISSMSTDERRAVLQSLTISERAEIRAAIRAAGGYQKFRPQVLASCLTVKRDASEKIDSSSSTGSVSTSSNTAKTDAIDDEHDSEFSGPSGNHQSAVIDSDSNNVQVLLPASISTHWSRLHRKTKSLSISMDRGIDLTSNSTSESDIPISSEHVDSRRWSTSSTRMRELSVPESPRGDTEPPFSSSEVSSLKESSDEGPPIVGRNHGVSSSQGNRKGIGNFLSALLRGDEEETTVQIRTSR